MPSTPLGEAEAHDSDPAALQLIELLYEAAESPTARLAILSERFRVLLHEKFVGRDENPDLPQLAQIENPLRDIAKIAGAFRDHGSRRDAYVEALGFGIANIYHRLGPLDQDVLGLWLSCTRPARAKQLALLYKEEWYKPPQPRMERLQCLLAERRLYQLLARGLFEEGGEKDASTSFLDWIDHSLPERHDQRKAVATFHATLGSLRHSFFDSTADYWRDCSEERRRRCLQALAGGLFFLRTRNRKSNRIVDPLVLRVIIHWRPWQKCEQAVAAYDSLEGISEFVPAAFIENRLYRALAKVGIRRLRVPNELAAVAVALIAQSATRLLCHNEPEGPPSRDALCRWINEAVERVFHLPLLAIAYAQESSLPPGRRSRGRPQTLKLLPFLQCHSELARREKHVLAGDLPQLVAGLGDLDLDAWNDDEVYDAAQWLFDVAYEWRDRGENAIPPGDLPKIRRLKWARALFARARRRSRAFRRAVVGHALDEEIALLDRRLPLR